MLSYQLLRKRSYNPLFHDTLTTGNNEETNSVYICIHLYTDVYICMQMYIDAYICIQMHTDVCRCIQMYTAV